MPGIPFFVSIILDFCFFPNIKGLVLNNETHFVTQLHHFQRMGICAIRMALVPISFSKVSLRRTASMFSTSPKRRCRNANKLLIFWLVFRLKKILFRHQKRKTESLMVFRNYRPIFYFHKFW